FELFERTSDIDSAIKILLDMIGDLFALDRILVCSFDAGFGVSRVSCQWNYEGLKPVPSIIEKISHDELFDFESALDENGSLRYDDETAGDYGIGAVKLLCLVPGESVSGYCCAMYENGMHVGRVLFISSSRERSWTQAEIRDLGETAKIIAAHMTIEKSNSASRAKSEFLSRISHEIRTPMNAIIGMTDIAMNNVNDSKRLGDSLAKIDFSAKHLLTLINDVLDMSSIESGKFQINRESFPLGAFMDGIEMLMRQSLESRGLEFEIISRCKSESICGDENRLRQVLVNLLGNAGKFTGSGGKVTLTVAENAVSYGADGEMIFYKFSVKDTGIGIAPEDQPFIFKAFEQAKLGTHAQKQQGTGLGLAISANIVSMMGGQIELISSPGEGSEFFFSICSENAADTQGSKEPEGDESDYSGLFKGKRALLVDDIEINIEIAKYLLEETGIDIDIACDGLEAVTVFEASAQNHYDVILMDVQMPVMDGLSAARKIRGNLSREDARTVPIIAMTANAFDEDMKKSVESGMNGHIAKPIDANKLFALLKQILL
ncbi:MAG: ATP-binding protein, partial [Defluviitaleaceae bacterium]|nr:ATP-binding protein [Defluviitaleaceae bacterium]